MMVITAGAYYRWCAALPTRYSPAISGEASASSSPVMRGGAALRRSHVPRPTSRTADVIENRDRSSVANLFALRIAQDDLSTPRR